MILRFIDRHYPAIASAVMILGVAVAVIVMAASAG